MPIFNSINCNKPTVRVGPSGVQRVEYAPEVYTSEQPQDGPRQQVVVRISVEERLDTLDPGLLRRMVLITIRVEFCVDMAPGFARINAYDVESPYDERTDAKAKCEISTGRALCRRDYEYHDRSFFERDKPFDLVIFDPGNVLRWLGSDFVASMASDQQHLPTAKKRIE